MGSCGECVNGCGSCGNCGLVRICWGRDGVKEYGLYSKGGGVGSACCWKGENVGGVWERG